MEKIRDVPGCADYHVEEDEGGEKVVF